MSRAAWRWPLAAAVFAIAAALSLAARATHERKRPLPPPPSAAETKQTPTPSLAARALVGDRARRIEIGREIFFDRALSEPGGTSCASCHDPKRAFAGNHGSSNGVALGSRPNHFARRNTPSLLYLKYVRNFHFRWEEDAQLPDPTGGFFWDGRADSLAELVQQPLLNPDEMGNRDRASIALKLKAASYADALANEFDQAFRDDDATLRAMGQALEAFLTSDEMTPFSSKYDRYIRKQAELSPLEREGLEAFRDPNRGGCAICHKMNDASSNPERSLFTDYGFEALAVPRNRKLAATRDQARFDLGLCEKDSRRFPMDRETWCGSFRTPSLRNVAVRTHYMHNGAFSELREVVKFYVTRGITPKRWYKGGAYDDVPEKYRALVGVERVPYDRHPGQLPRLSDHEIDAVVAFLRTLTDAAYE